MPKRHHLTTFPAAIRQPAPADSRELMADSPRALLASGDSFFFARSNPPKPHSRPRKRSFGGFVLEIEPTPKPPVLTWRRPPGAGLIPPTGGTRQA